jgi:hypothetical protein
MATRVQGAVEKGQRGSYVRLLSLNERLERKVECKQWRLGDAPTRRWASPYLRAWFRSGRNAVNKPIRNDSL